MSFQCIVPPPLSFSLEKCACTYLPTFHTVARCWCCVRLYLDPATGCVQAHCLLWFVEGRRLCIMDGFSMARWVFQGQMGFPGPRLTGKFGHSTSKKDNATSSLEKSGAP